MNYTSIKILIGDALELYKQYSEADEAMFGKLSGIGDLIGAFPEKVRDTVIKLRKTMSAVDRKLDEIEYPEYVLKQESFDLLDSSVNVERKIQIFEEIVADMERSLEAINNALDNLAEIEERLMMVKKAMPILAEQCIRFAELPYVTPYDSFWKAEVPNTISDVLEPTGNLASSMLKKTNRITNELNRRRHRLESDMPKAKDVLQLLYDYKKQKDANAISDLIRSSVAPLVRKFIIISKSALIEYSLRDAHPELRIRNGKSNVP